MKAKILAIVVVLLLVLAGVVAYQHGHKKSQPASNLSSEIQSKLDNDVAKQQSIIKDNKDANDVFQAYLQLGIDYTSLGQFNDAKDAYLKSAELQPTSWIPWSNLGSLYETMKDQDQAGPALQKALNLGPTVLLNWQKAIEFERYWLKASDARIREMYAAAFKATNDNVQLHQEFATYLEQVKDIKGALNQWQLIAKLNPANTQAKGEITRLQKLLKK